MGDLTKNLSRHEMACNCGCGQDASDYEIVKAFQEVCNETSSELNVAKVVAIITSGNRCKKWNEKEGGQPTSKHLYGKAIDFYIIGLKYDTLSKICENILDAKKFYWYRIKPDQDVIHLQLR